MCRTCCWLRCAGEAVEPINNTRTLQQALLSDAAIATLSCAAALAGHIESFAALPFANFPVFAGGYQHVVELHAGDK